MSPGLRVRGRFTLTAGMSALYIEQSTRFNRQNDSFLLTYRQHRELTAGKSFSFSNFKGYLKSRGWILEDSYISEGRAN